jgi:hypothetical protein
VVVAVAVGQREQVRAVVGHGERTVRGVAGELDRDAGGGDVGPDRADRLAVGAVEQDGAVELGLGGDVVDLGEERLVLLSMNACSPSVTEPDCAWTESAFMRWRMSATRAMPPSATWRRLEA